MRRLGTLDPETDYVIESQAFWYLVGYFGHEELPDSFFEKYTQFKKSRKQTKTHGSQVKEKILLLKDDPKLAHT